MAGIHYLGKAWQDNSEPPDDYGDDLEELPITCMECGVELEGGDELRCVECMDELKSSPPERGEDDWIDQYYEDTVSDPPL